MKYDIEMKRKINLKQQMAKEKTNSVVAFQIARNNITVQSVNSTMSIAQKTLT